MRGLSFFFIFLFSLTSITLAQTEPLQPSADFADIAINLTKAEMSPPALAEKLIEKTDWQIRMPDNIHRDKETLSQPAAILALKPKPIELVMLSPSNPYHRLGFEFSLGVYHPNGQLRNTNLLNTTLGLGFGVAIRPSESWSRLQFDAGTDLVIDGIGSPRKEEIAPGTFRGIDDVEAFFYLGPRVFLTQRERALKLSLGGGGTFAYYKEATQTYDDDNNGDANDTPCFSCESRKGWGAYAMAQLRYQIAPEFGVGVTAKYYRVKTNSDANLPNRTIDNWLGVMLTVSFR